jgi:hypothetical protein
VPQGVAILPRRLNVIQQSVSAGDNQANGGQLWGATGKVGFKKNGVDMAFEVIYGHQRLAKFSRQNFPVCHADQQRADQSWSIGYANGVEIAERKAGLGQGFANDWNNLPKMFARGEFRHYAAIFTMNVQLGSDDARYYIATVHDDCRGGFIARRFNSKNARWHGLFSRVGEPVC